MLLIPPNGFLSTFCTPKHLLEASIHPMDIPKNFWENRFGDLKFHFSSFKAFRAWKNAFLSKIQRTKLFSRVYFMARHARGRKYRTKWKDLSIRFLIKDLFFEKSHFLHPYAQKSSQNIRKSFIFCLKKSKKIQNFRFS